MNLQEETGLQVVASGGVSKLSDVRSAYQGGLAGVIIGRALYDGDIALRDAIIQVNIV
jgi:phosphoribosylformimino-5-aminoimidazole carboxamide ribotide isomerase